MERGIDLKNDAGDVVAHVAIKTTHRDIDLVCTTVADGASTLSAYRLEPEQCRELAGAFKDAAVVAEAYDPDLWTTDDVRHAIDIDDPDLWTTDDVRHAIDIARGIDP